MNNWKPKLKNKSIYNSSPQNEILKHKPNKTCTGFKLKEIKEELKNGREISCSWTGRLRTVKMSILPKLIYRFNLLPTIIPVEFSVYRFKRIQKCTRKSNVT